MVIGEDVAALVAVGYIPVLADASALSDVKPPIQRLAESGVVERCCRALEWCSDHGSRGVSSCTAAANGVRYGGIGEEAGMATNGVVALVVRLEVPSRNGRHELHCYGKGGRLVARQAPMRRWM